MVFANGFGLEIVTSGIDLSRPNGEYVALRNGSEYKIRLCNQRETRCDVDVHVDGEKIGSWRINPFDCIAIERPVDDSHMFTFFSERSYQASRANVNVGNFNNGLISATFYPEKKHYHPEPILSLP